MHPASCICSLLFTPHSTFRIRETGPLNKVNVDGLQGKKLLLTGYLHASKGDCKKAQLSFDVAQKKGEECVPDEYKSNCK